MTTPAEQTQRVTDYKEIYREVLYQLEAKVRESDWSGPARADLAALRRGMSQPMGSVLEVARVIEPMLLASTPDFVAETVYVVAPLFAHHRKSHENRYWHNNMGAHFLELCEPDQPPRANIRRHFEELCRSDPDDLAESLRQAISLLKQKDVAVNWQQLFSDAHDWLDRRPEGESKRQRIRLNWAKSFWRLPEAQKRTDTPA